MQIQSLGQEDSLEPQQPVLVFLPGESMDRGAWQATVHRVTKSRTQLKQLIMHMHAGLLLQKKRYRLNFSFLLGMLFRNVHIGNKKFLIGLFRSQVDVTS